MPKPAPGTRADYATFLPITTRWMDNDVFGHVNNATYYSFFDTAVCSFLVGHGVLDWVEGEHFMVVAESGCRYHSELAFPDLITAGLRVAQDDGWSDILSRVLVTLVEPHLGHGRATILDRYPAPEAALARRAGDDPRVAERFELYACGVELANGFGELTDPAEQRRRFAAEMAEKARVHGETYPVDEDFLSALAQMPPASGIALGFDRLMMLATGAPRIDEVMWTPVP